MSDHPILHPGSSRWTVMMMGDHGWVRRWPWRPAIGRALAAGAGIMLMALAGMVALVSAQLREQQALTAALADAERQVAELSAANTAMTARIAAVRQKIESTMPTAVATAPVMFVGGQGGDEPASKDMDWAAVRDMTVDDGFHPVFTYRLVNTDAGNGRIDGRTIVVFGCETLAPVRWRAWPPVPLDKGRPIAADGGTRFAIRNYKIEAVPVPAPPAEATWTVAVVYVYDSDGRLRLAQRHLFETTLNATGPLAVSGSEPQS